MIKKGKEMIIGEEPNFTKEKAIKKMQDILRSQELSYWRITNIKKLDEKNYLFEFEYETKN